MGDHQGYPICHDAAAVIEHQKVISNIHIQLTDLLSNCNKCTALLPVDWKIDDDTVVQPDNLVVCGEVGGKYLTVTPIMIFEITSRATAFKDKNVKFKIYEATGSSIILALT